MYEMRYKFSEKSAIGIVSYELPAPSASDRAEINLGSEKELQLPRPCSFVKG